MEKGKRKKRKDPEAPKAVVNAYMIFCKTNRPRLKVTHTHVLAGVIIACLRVMY
jgi:hypothetical protein